MPVQPGDLVSLLIGPRDGNHACDLTAVDLTLAGGGHEWNLARRRLARHPRRQSPRRRARQSRRLALLHRARQGGPGESVIPAGSLLARWQTAATADEKQRLAHELEALLTSGPPAAKDSPDGLLVPPARLAARPARRAPSGLTGPGVGPASARG